MKRTERTGANKRKHLVEKQGPRREFPWRRIMPVVMVAAGIGAAVAAVPHLRAWVYSSPMLIVKRIDVSVPAGVDTAEVRRISGIARGMRIGELSPRRARAALAGYRWAREITVSRRLPDKVRINLVNRRPIAYASLGRVLCLDDEGFVYAGLPSAPATLPLVFGLRDTATDAAGNLRVSKATLANVRGILKDLVTVDPGLAGQVAAIDVADPGRVNLTLVGGNASVELDRTNTRERLQRLKKILEMMKDNRPSRINLCYSNLAFVR